MPRPPVNFRKPPVVEVVCGVLFDVPQPLRAAHVGLFWSTVRDQFPATEDASVVLPMTERDAGPQIGDIPTAGDLQPLRRSWLVSADGRNLIQLQADRFLFNWKRASDEDNYPSYESVIAGFDRHLPAFRQFLIDQQIGEMTITQCELTYVNHIGDANGLKVLERQELFPDHRAEPRKDRFLPPPDAFNWLSSYRLPNERGRLHVRAQVARKTATLERIVQLDITARGAPTNSSPNALREWFDLGHEWITHGFADFTDSKLHQIWERQS
jgi:uncharacterized protein (TIGR04255 family)